MYVRDMLFKYDKSVLNSTIPDYPGNDLAAFFLNEPVSLRQQPEGGHIVKHEDKSQNQAKNVTEK